MSLIKAHSCLSLGHGASCARNLSHKAFTSASSQQRCSVKTPALSPGEEPSIASRRQLLQLASFSPLLLSRPALAEDIATAPAVESAAPPPQRLEDSDFALDAPASYKFIFIETPKAARGPAPERSPVRVRLDSPDGQTVLSVVMRNAQTLKATLLQVSDISMFGEPEAAANLLLPRGSVLLSSDSEVVQPPPKETPIGLVEVPPRTYYRYEFTTTNGLHVYMTAAAQRGRVYLCGATSPVASWEAVRADVVLQYSHSGSGTGSCCDQGLHQDQGTAGGVLKLDIKGFEGFGSQGSWQVSRVLGDQGSWARILDGSEGGSSDGWLGFEASKHLNPEKSCTDMGPGWDIGLMFQKFCKRAVVVQRTYASVVYQVCT
eukprot:CAMPEP_0202891054 /NCGR_PEP_ID=MMETSP1392-20130828/1241_1 /ASSEMBLY_ACC=CAM_ASM_000868 /TAXON_ID=225041 /ORGANISM="Chlamydomonas chlamydogama, Strain SAG 11-48b" /LENGTH=374 /DNA_ID=CAMNT_0049574723 /DNA_START=32 /DNA_END=1158 /DNA_ORIENTATION=+